MRSLPLRPLWQPLVRKWDELHVERHGTYSVERMYQFKLFCERTSVVRAICVILLTPMPCFVIGVAINLLPLEPPEKGLSHSALFWLRLLFVSWLILFAILKQCRRFVAGVPMSLWEIFIASFFVAAGSTASAFGLAVYIGFPLPFTIALESPVALVLLVVALAVIWGKYLPRNRSVQRDVLNCVFVISTQLTLTYVYPGYTCIFRQLGAASQVVFALLLPAMKLAAKNLMSFLLQSVEDLKPEFIIFNVEVFHALFVSSCLQSTTSTATTSVLICTDVVFGAFALRQILKMTRKFHSSVNPASRTASSACAPAADDVASQTQWHTMHVVDIAIYLLEANPALLEHRTVRLFAQGTLPRINQIQPSCAPIVVATPPSVENVAASASASPAVASPAAVETTQLSNFTRQSVSTCVDKVNTRVKEHGVQAPTRPPLRRSLTARRTRPNLHKLNSVRALLDSVALDTTLTPSEQRLARSLSAHDQLRYVQHVLQLLFWVEFILLVEFTEVIIPLVYSAYLFVVFHLPHREYHTQLQGLDYAALRNDIAHIVAYALLELVTLLCMLALLRRAIRCSTVRLLAFVLQSQWTEVQAKLILWVVYSLQTTVVHYGVDFTFAFAWLDRPITTEPGTVSASANGGGA